MELKMVERASNLVKLQIEGEGHTFCNALQDILLKDEAVEFAGYSIPHPLIKSAVFTMRTKEGQDPIEALRRAAAKLKEDAAAFRQSFEEAYKQP